MVEGSGRGEGEERKRRCGVVEEEDKEERGRRGGVVEGRGREGVVRKRGSSNGGVVRRRRRCRVKAAVPWALRVTPPPPPAGDKQPSHAVRIHFLSLTCSSLGKQNVSRRSSHVEINRNVKTLQRSRHAASIHGRNPSNFLREEEEEEEERRGTSGSFLVNMIQCVGS